jgi:hypothetical protein
MKQRVFPSIVVTQLLHGVKCSSIARPGFGEECIRVHTSFVRRALALTAGELAGFFSQLGHKSQKGVHAILSCSTQGAFMNGLLLVLTSRAVTKSGLVRTQSASAGGGAFAAGLVLLLVFGTPIAFVVWMFFKSLP